MKSLYIAGKLNSGEVSISEFASELEGRGHTILEKWWELGLLPTPYLQNLDTSAPAAQAMIRAAYNSDVTILFADAKILGAAVEFGAGLASTLVRDDKQLVVVDPWARESVFYTHPAVTPVANLDGIRSLKWY